VKEIRKELMMVHFIEKEKKQAASCFQIQYKNESLGVAKTRSALENQYNYFRCSSAVRITS
jgi:hypothetical protein